MRCVQMITAPLNSMRRRLLTASIQGCTHRILHFSQQVVLFLYLPNSFIALIALCNDVPEFQPKTVTKDTSPHLISSSSSHYQLRLAMNFLCFRGSLGLRTWSPEQARKNFQHAESPSKSMIEANRYKDSTS